MVRHGTVWVHAPLGFDLYGPGDSIFVALADTGGIHPFLVQHRSWLSRVPLRGSPDHARCRGNCDKIDAEMVERFYVCLLAGSFSDVSLHHVRRAVLFLPPLRLYKLMMANGVCARTALRTLKWACP